MASLINSGESLFVPFRNGHSISDSQLKPRMYKSKEAFQKNFPGYYTGTEGVELVEYAPVVRCKDCKWYRIAPIDNVPYCCHESGYCGEYMGGLFFCACGERKDNG